MNCPKCGKEMQSGFLQAGNLIAFNKTQHKISLLSKAPEDVMIAQKSFASTDFRGFICKDCGLIVFNYKDAINPLVMGWPCAEKYGAIFIPKTERM